MVGNRFRVSSPTARRWLGLFSVNYNPRLPRPPLILTLSAPLNALLMTVYPGLIFGWVVTGKVNCLCVDILYLANKSDSVKRVLGTQRVCSKITTTLQSSVWAFSFANFVSGFAIDINNFGNCAARITVRC